jgi:hypothetical protein
MRVDCTPSPLRFDGLGLRLGSSEIGSIGVAFDKERARALVEAAFGREHAKCAAPYLALALKRYADGEKALALICLALTGLPALSSVREAEWRLAHAGNLLAAGVSARAILDGLADQDSAETIKYSPDQPRVPAGHGRKAGVGPTVTTTMAIHQPTTPTANRMMITGFKSPTIQPIGRSI